MTEKPIENENPTESVTSDLPEEVVEAMHKGQQLTIERARKLAQVVSTAATTAVQHLPGRQLAHRLPAPIRRRPAQAAQAAGSRRGAGRRP